MNQGSQLYRRDKREFQNNYMIDFKIQGDQYWRFENRKIDGDFPHKISDDFPGIPDDLDAGSLELCVDLTFSYNKTARNATYFS